jgi:hypothetical protein
VARGGWELRRILTLGGRTPASAGGLAIAVVVASCLTGLFRGTATYLALIVDPAAGAESGLEAWRYLTWPFPQPFGDFWLLNLFFGAASVVWIGRSLSYAWSERRFLGWFFTLTVVAGLGTWVLLWPLGVRFGYIGVWPVVNGLLVTWGLLFPNQRVSLWLSGATLSGAGVARALTIGTPIYALVAGASPSIPARLLEFVPHFVALAMAWLPSAGGPRRAWYRLTDWWLRRRLREQRRKFKVVGTDDRPPRQWMN